MHGHQSSRIHLRPLFRRVLDHPTSSGTAHIGQLFACTFGTSPLCVSDLGELVALHFCYEYGV